MSVIHFDIIDDTIGQITFNRPEAANALSTELLIHLNKILDKLEILNDLRVIIITATGDKAFCAGADLKERKTMNEDEVVNAVHYIHETANRIDAIKIPVIAAINGVAFGGGLEFALACDIRIIADHATIGLTETSLAIIPGAGGTQRLSRLIGVGQAKHLIYRAARINANEAYRLGIAEEIVTASSLHDAAIAYAKQIAENGPLAVQLAKTAINKGIELPLNEALQLEKQLYGETIQTEDRQEGLNAFSEKRKPKYVGK